MRSGHDGTCGQLVLMPCRLWMTGYVGNIPGGWQGLAAHEMAAGVLVACVKGVGVRLGHASAFALATCGLVLAGAAACAIAAMPQIASFCPSWQHVPE